MAPAFLGPRNQFHPLGYTTMTLNKYSFAIVWIVVMVCGIPAEAQTVLNDWCLNVNGESTSACSSSPALPGNVDASGFDQTLNAIPGTPNSLGSITVTLGAGTGQFLLAYMDYDLNFGSSGSFQDIASVHGTLPPGYAFELADPAGSIFANFSGNTLANVNSVGTGSAPPLPCCDVAWAIGISGLNVSAGSQAAVTFAVSSTAPTTGFYLQETNLQNGSSIYLTATVAAVPEPATAALLAVGLVPVFLLGRFRRARKVTLST